jgi:hypothetical protein
MNDNREIPAELSWVTALAKCSLLQVFTTLRLGVESDVEEINALIQPGIQMKFYVANHGKRFAVICEVNGAPSHEVEFGLRDNDIVIVENHTVKYEVGLTLNNAGVCKLQIDGEELEQWQVRRKALEGLFFDKNRGRYL